MYSYYPDLALNGFMELSIANFYRSSWVLYYIYVVLIIKWYWCYL